MSISVDGVPVSTWLVVAFVTIAAIAVIITSVQIGQHIRRYTVPAQQRCIVRILLTVPIYAIYSVLCLLLGKYQVYFAILRDTYEAYALYMFFVLAVEFAGGWNNLILVYESHPITRLLIPLWCMTKPNKRLLNLTRMGILQYTLLRPLVAIACTVLLILGYYKEGEWGAKNFYTYATVLNNIGCFISLYFLAMFYKVTKEELSPYKPLLKFACIKMIVFFCYWQSVVIAILVGLKYIPTIEGWSSGEFAAAIQNGLICFEMFIFALAYLRAFPSDIYKIRAMSQKPLVREVEMEGKGGLTDVISQKDVLKDTVHAFVPDKIISKVKNMKQQKPVEKEEMKQVTLEEWKLNHELEKANIISYDHLAHEFVREMNQHTAEQTKNGQITLTQLDEDQDESVPDDLLDIRDVARR